MNSLHYKAVVVWTRCGHRHRIKTRYTNLTDLQAERIVQWYTRHKWVTCDVCRASTPVLKFIAVADCLACRQPTAPHEPVEPGRPGEYIE
jgi:uncharacterized CHY-type Zn-finger protein